MRLTLLLTAAMLIAPPARGQRQPTLPEVSPTEKARTQNQGLAQGGAAAGATPSADVPPGSIARIRAALAKPPPTLQTPNRTADFSVHIEERLPLQEIFDTPPWATSAAAPGWGPAGARSGGFSPPLVSFDVLPLLLSAKRAYSEHAAQEEVKRAIADYCAVQPDAGVGIQTCSPSR